MKLPDEHRLAPRWVGRSRVLDVIRLHGPVARIDIARLTGMSPATVTAVTADLLEARMIMPEPLTQRFDSAKRGRPRARLQLQPEAFIVAGMKVGSHAITTIFTDFAGTEIGHAEHALPSRQNDPEVLSREISVALTQGCNAFNVSCNDIAGAAIGLAGYIDGATGFVHWSSSLSTRSIDFTGLLRQHLPCPVFIENDVNLVAKAEHLFGLGKGLNSFLVATIEHGIGLGIMLDGVLHRGARGCGAEFGHTKITADGPMCQCGQRGCLEAYAGEYAIIARANQLRDGPPHQNIAQVIAAAEHNDPAASAAIKEAQNSFAIGLANLVNLFDPEEIIIASQIGVAHPLCANAVLDKVRSMVVQVDRPMPQLRVHGWDDLMWARGAAAHALEEVSSLRLKAL